MSVTLITGASSGLGAALARTYAAAGETLLLTARDPARLAAAAEACRARGATVETASLDVRDRDAVAAWIDAIDARTPVDRVVANAGINGGSMGGRMESEETALDVVATNLVGVLHVVLPLVPRMEARGAGQIALISSLAAFAPLPDAPAYSGAKAALVAHGLALREKLRPSGLRVNVVCPGYILTPMGREYEKGWRPLEMTPEAAARRIVRGLARDEGLIAFPSALAALARGATLVPERLRRLAMDRFSFSMKERR